MDRMVLEAKIRPPLTRGELNQLRREGKVPAVIYGRGKDTQSLLVDGRLLGKVLSMGGTNVLIDLQIENGAGSNQETVMLKEIQRHLWQPDYLLHVDFIRISMEDEIEVEVPLNFVGEAAGTAEGGITQILLREVSVKCLPVNIPEIFEVDLSSLEIGDSISAGSLTLPEGVTLLTGPEETLVQVLVPEEEEEEEEEEELLEVEGEGEEAAPEGEEKEVQPDEEEARK
ncbi:MAG: 50S ribosomal protein L25 [Dethiobacteria bacterium]|jgi:large subunit ribosomal protein L25|nr:50S ribosomal protein L25 [Bacillota bacterium]NMD33450.1 50S ribosomal protein L25 [Bacillota bacterium]HOB29632.1 50S ribosomal protein L25 [Bacillota bacterium]HPZ40921.1 50S ribosomal protein L25 [Bacillota bacterium]HQD52012.1 50S ribosomal protein L25 [Bacillota bacterium]